MPRSTQCTPLHRSWQTSSSIFGAMTFTDATMFPFRRYQMPVQRTAIFHYSFQHLPELNNTSHSKTFCFCLMLCTLWSCGIRREIAVMPHEKRKENTAKHRLEKTKIGIAREHAASRPNLLEVPADHKVFVKRRCNFVPARRHPVDQLDGGPPAGSRRIARKEGALKLVQLSLFPPHPPSATDLW